ncbi:metallophosphoesterase [Kaarinaea lacus]
MRFITVGDVGTGSDEQYRVAKAMENKCNADGCDFVLLLGDNIYDNGVDSISDAQFQSKFELPYKNINVPFYVALGNHDYGGNGAGFEYQKSLFQIDYSGVSGKWRMPGHYFNFIEGNISFIALDTNGQMYEIDDNQRDEVSAWINNSNSDWNIVFGHHPYKSNGNHGNAGKYEGISGIPVLSGDGVKSFAEDIWCGKVDLYISGHDHSRQWLDVHCNGTELVISGAGAKTTDLPGNNPRLFQANTTGYLYVFVDGNVLTAQFINSDGEVEFTRTIEK